MDDRAQSSRITMDELLAEVNKYAADPKRLDEEQKTFLRACKEKNITWPLVEKLWAKRWPHLNGETLRKRFHSQVRE